MSPRPVDFKGVLFDTDATHFGPRRKLEYMLGNNRAAAWGKVQYFVEQLNADDLVFFYEKGVGVVAVGRIVDGKVYHSPNGRESWVDVEILSPKPGTYSVVPPGLSPSEIQDITGKTFYWPRTIKTPTLNYQEVTNLKEALLRRITDLNRDLPDGTRAKRISRR